MRTSLTVFALSLVCSSLVAPAPAAAMQSSDTGVVAGRVLDGVTGNPLQGAAVVVDGAVSTTSSDRDGRFRVPGLTIGSHTISVTYLGRREAKVTVDVKTDNTAAPVVTLTADDRYQESVDVTALQGDAMARALNQQRTAPNITNVVSADQIGHFPDPNAAETTQRIPGVSIQRDMGEGRYIIVRGTEPRLNSTMIDGERIPAPEADKRQVALDVIPADLLQSVEVSKALTPDMDADAIGGAVNLVMKQAPSRLEVFATLGSGYVVAQDSYKQPTANVTIGRRFANNRMGVIFSGSTSGTLRNTQDFEPAYTSGNLMDLDLRNYTVNRRRHGLTGAMDFRPAAARQYSVRGVYNNYVDDHEERQRVRQRVVNRRIERELRDRTHIEHIWSMAFTGTEQFGRGALTFRFSGAHADQKDPLTIATTFRQSNVNFAPNVTPTSIDPDNVQANPLNENLAASTFNQQVRATNFAGERDIVGGADLRLMGGSRSGLTSFFKFGVKLRDKDKDRTRDEFTLTLPSGAAAIPLSAVVVGDGVSHTILDGRYTLGPYMSMATAAGMPSNYTFVSTENHARDTEDFTVGEQVVSGYGMAELYVGPRLFLLPGVRVEHTASDYTGNQVNFAPVTGAWVSTTPISGSHDYTTVLPGVNLRFAVNEQTNLRAAVTRSLARPNYIDLVPYRSFDDNANRLALGNPDLRPTLSINTDLMVEHYLKSIGLISGGVFFKQLHDYIYVFVENQPINNEVIEVTQSRNGESASLRGLELALQTQLRFLPKPFDGLGLYANYTFTDSTAEFPGRTGEAATLPGQSRHVGNLAFSYEKGGFSGRAAVNFHGSYIDQVASASGQDRFYDTHKQYDISFSQRLMRHYRLYLDALNLTDAPLRYFQGVQDRPLQEEHYRWWMAFGVKVDWR